MRISLLNKYLNLNQTLSEERKWIVFRLFKLLLLSQVTFLRLLYVVIIIIKNTIISIIMINNDVISNNITEHEKLAGCMIELIPATKKVRSSPRPTKSLNLKSRW